MLLNEKKNHYLRTGLILTGLMTALALVGCVWTPYSPTAMSGSEKFLAPCLRHLFGTDNFGRDIFSRVLAGAGTTFFISAATVCIGAAVGTLVGAFTGYFGGWLDEALMRINDAVTAFPSILLALVFISLLGFGKYNVILALGVAFVPSYARVIRSEFARHREMNYVKSARLMGAGHLRIMFLHILPNTRQVLLPTLVIGFNNAVLAEASMSYLGIGVKPPGRVPGVYAVRVPELYGQGPLVYADGGRRDRAADFRRQPAGRGPAAKGMGEVTVCWKFAICMCSSTGRTTRRCGAST